jgi:hypothetical protein
VTGRKHQFRDPAAQARAVAQIVNQRRTCEGCAFLRTYPRPMCQGETSPHFRTARDTYHDQCGAFERGQRREPVQAAPNPDAPASHVKTLINRRGGRR